MDRLLIEETGEQQPQQISGDGRDGGFGRQVLAVEMVDAAQLRIGNEQLIGKLENRRVHGGSIGQPADKGKETG